MQLVELWNILLIVFLSKKLPEIKPEDHFLTHFIDFSFPFVPGMVSCQA